MSTSLIIGHVTDTTPFTSGGADIGSGDVFDESRYLFDLSGLDRFIAERGVFFEWRRGITCPCARVETHEPRGTCLVCKGIGTAYPPRRVERTVAMMTSRAPTTEERAAGVVITGRVTMSFPTEAPIPRLNDLVFPQEILDPCITPETATAEDWTPFELHVVEEQLTRAYQPVGAITANATIDAPYQAPPVPPVAPEVLRYDDPVSIDEIVWIEGDQLVMGRGGYRIHTDEKGRTAIRWAPQAGPAAGQVYTVRYTAPAAYVIIESQFRGTGNKRLPRKIDAIRLDQWTPGRDRR